MPTDDQQVLVAGIASAPATFTIPGNGQIQPKAIYAVFDGANAGSPFYPALKIVSDGGEVVGIYPTCGTIAAGGTAAVSWFPDVAPCCGEQAEPTSTGTIEALTSAAGTLTVTAPTGPSTNLDLAPTAVTPGTYGDATNVSQITVDADGRITSAADVAIASTGGTISDLTSTGGTLTITNPLGPTTNVDMPASGVTAATYGSASNVPQITVDAEGRVTAAANVAIGGGTIVAADGWVDDTAETWTYASFTAGPPAVGTFTVAGDLRFKYTVGTRVKLTQTTAKYFVVCAAPTFAGGNTTVSICGGTDYTLANAAISANYHSYVVNPQGYPTWFTFAPAVTGLTSIIANYAKFCAVGQECTVVFRQTGTSNATTFGLTAPIPFADVGVTNVNWGTIFQGTDNGVGNSTPAALVFTSSTAIRLDKVSGTPNGWTNSGTKSAVFTFTYAI